MVDGEPLAEGEFDDDLLVLATKERLDEVGDQARKAVVLDGSINPDADLRVGVFQVVRDGQPDLAKGILSAEEARDLAELRDMTARVIAVDDFAAADLKRKDRNPQDGGGDRSRRA